MGCGVSRIAPDLSPAKQEAAVAKEVLARFDWWTYLLLDKLIDAFQGLEPMSADHMSRPELEKITYRRLYVGKTEFLNHEVDATCGELSFGSYIALRSLRVSLFFQLEDRVFDVDEMAIRCVMRYTGIHKILPKPNVVFCDPQSDAALTRIAFYGAMQHVLCEVSPDEVAAPPGAQFKVDFSAMEALPVRGDFAKYGGCAYFDTTLAPIGILLYGKVVTPDMGHEWEVAKFTWKVLSFRPVLDGQQHASVCFRVSAVRRVLLLTSRVLVHRFLVSVHDG